MPISFRAAMHSGKWGHICAVYNAIIACGKRYTVVLRVWVIFKNFKVDNGIAHGMIHAETHGWVEMSDYQGFMNI